VTIKGVEGLTVEQVMAEIERGSRFVLFEYAISLLIVSFRRPSAIYFVRPGESRRMKGLRYTLLSLVAGWWGIPWGPIYTIQVLITDLRGGKDVTQEVMAALSPPAEAGETAASPSEAGA
jgi:hypothetical protein